MSELSPEQVAAVTYAVCGLPASAAQTRSLEAEPIARRWEAVTGLELAMLCAALEHYGANEAVPMTNAIKWELARRETAAR